MDYILGVDGGNTKTDYFLFDLEGNFETINEHEEPWLVLDIKKDVYLLFNLKNQRKYKMHEKEFFAKSI